MSKKRNTVGETVSAQNWMAPISADSPCGPDLEYDPEFILLFAQVAARMDAQYGDFVGTPEPINWSDVERDCRRLMARTKDIRLAVLFTRCRTNLAAAAGLAEGLGLLAAWLESFAQTLHPYPGVDEDLDVAMEIRMNALQGLTDADGLMADVRNIALARSSVAPLKVRDVERAFAMPRPVDALSVESVSRQLHDLRAQQPDLIAHFVVAIDKLGAIDKWNREHLGTFVADLSAITRLLGHVAGEAPLRVEAIHNADAIGPIIDAPSNEVEDEAIREPEAEMSSNVSRSVAPTSHANREDALQSIRAARRWFELYEPSSPIPVLLKRAEAFVGKSYAEVVRAIPVELLAEWENDA